MGCKPFSTAAIVLSFCASFNSRADLEVGEEVGGDDPAPLPLQARGAPHQQGEDEGPGHPKEPLGPEEVEVAEVRHGPAPSSGTAHRRAGP